MNTLRASQRTQAGVGLIELMIALVIGLFLILGAVTVLNQSRNAYRTAEKVARLQETGRLAMQVVESDLRHANFWGMNNRAADIVNRVPVGGTVPADFTTTQQNSAAVCKESASGTTSHFVLNLDEYIGGVNNGYGLNCGAINTYLAGRDTVWIRRASTDRPAAMNANRIHLQTSRIRGTMFVPACTDPTNTGCIPADYLPPASQTRELEVHVYYVARDSTNRANLPSLRRKRFANVNSTADAFIDEEIVPGIEDLQVRLGVDTNGDTNADQYVNLGAVPAGANVVSATVWLLVRAEDREVGFVDDTVYRYADMAGNWTPNDGFRRLLLTRTIHIRNTRA